MRQGVVRVVRVQWDGGCESGCGARVIGGGPCRMRHEAYESLVGVVGCRRWVAGDRRVRVVAKTAGQRM